MSFDLSLAQDKEVVASKDYVKVKDDKTGEMKDKTTLDDGVRIDKSKAPKIIADGPLGYKYTEYLNQTLTNENMSAIVAAAEESEDASIDTSTVGSGQGEPTGYVVVDDNGISNQVDTSDVGYVYVIDAGEVTTSDMVQMAESVFKMKNKFPDRAIGVGVIHNGQVSKNASAVLQAMKNADVPVAVTQEGLARMVRSMALKIKTEGA